MEGTAHRVVALVGGLSDEKQVRSPCFLDSVVRGEGKLERRTLEGWPCTEQAAHDQTRMFSEWSQIRLLAREPDIVVATPGRLWELMRDRHHHLTALHRLRFLVIDEVEPSALSLHPSAPRSLRQ